MLQDFDPILYEGLDNKFLMLKDKMRKERRKMQKLRTDKALLKQNIKLL